MHDHIDHEHTGTSAGPAVSRRTLLAGTGAAAAIAATGVRADASASPARAAGGLKVHEGTDIAASVSPDGAHIAFDLLGVLWVIPRSGGSARRLTSDLYDITQPQWSPDASELVFQSYRDGVFNLWTVRPDGSGLRQLTEGPYDHREPRWSPDGSRIAFSGDASGSYGIYELEVETGNVVTVVDTAEEEYEPAYSPDGSAIAFAVANTRVDVVDRRSGARETVVSVEEPDIVHQPAWTPDGERVTYHLQSGDTMRLMIGEQPLVGDELAFPFQVSWLSDEEFVYTADGQIRSRRLGAGRYETIGFSAAVRPKRPRYRRRRREFEDRAPQQVKGIGSPVMSPDGRRVAFRALNDLWVMPLGGRPEPLTRDSWWKCDPAWSPDGRELAYSTDRAGTLDIWVRDLRTGNDRQLTSLGDRAALSAAWSPDGTEIAFLDQDGALWTIDVRSKEVQRVFPATFEPGRPTWSADGRVIALAAVSPYSRRYREGQSKILLVDRRSGRARYVDAIKNGSLQTRGDDGPVWSPDGRRMAFAAESALYVLEVGADGTPEGSARKVSDEVCDAPSWSGDSSTLLYLNNGRLRTVDADGGRARTVRVPLTWRNAQAPGTSVVHAGVMWDGESESVRRDVDIVIEGKRIVAVEPHREGRTGTLIDASDRFVMPGLIDMHNHREMAGYAYGARQGRMWLAMGITTTRSPGSPAYHMVEERESIQSGARLGPRYFATGEAIDGRRIYYNFMRPTFSDRQLGKEFERAEALEYDLIKCYVRLPAMWHKRAISFGHRMGVPVTSHYHYPAIAFGGDGMEHTGATNRFGFSRTVTPLGNGYDDVTALFNASHMARTPTLFGSSALYGEDRSLVEDRRTQAFYPPWRVSALTSDADDARDTDQTVALANLRRQVAQALAMVRGGGNVIAGTDAPIDHVAISLHMNLRAMVKYGFTPRAALVTATSAAGDHLNEPIGRLAPGAYADIAIVDGDPLSDIADAAAVDRVIVAGVEHTVDELLEPYESARTRTPGVAPNRVREPVPEPAENDRYWWHGLAYVEHARQSCCAG
ncbi:amidohydrolase family protein [Solicola gregarius]|uniref:Amidohydrolase family protein n=1 Tax=Solicola gregarius TaxID=2908642 RepID=A0AA46YLB3_9ACTN|nr:amidohydrolase family protein [Solicola gregarius]UYM04708.1 amidohydrolase family protein [Solicola gregarius]